MLDPEYILRAEEVAQGSNDPSTKTGAVLFHPHFGRIIGTGFNCHPAAVEEPEFLENRELKYKTIIHCEDWAVWNAMQAGYPTLGATLYTWPFMSCGTCAVKMVRAGIIRVVAPKSNNPRWQDDFALAQRIFAKAGVKVDLL